VDGVEQAELGVVETRGAACRGGPHLASSLRWNSRRSSTSETRIDSSEARSRLCALRIYVRIAYIYGVTEHLLDNPLWSSMTTSHLALARGTEDVRRYPPEVAPFLAVATAAASEAALATLVEPGESIFVVGPRPAAPHGWQLDDLGTILQMVSTEPLAPIADPSITALDERHRPAVLELAALVYPHYFRPRTMDLGRYFGIYEGTTLAAMIGERMGMPGFREISAYAPGLHRARSRQLLALRTNDIAWRHAVPPRQSEPRRPRARRRLTFADAHRDRVRLRRPSVCTRQVAPYRR
jgi:hypothetical protein